MDIERYRHLRAVSVNGDDGGAHCREDTKKKIGDSGGKNKGFGNCGRSGIVSVLDRFIRFLIVK